MVYIYIVYDMLLIKRQIIFYKKKKNSNYKLL